jgi:hypothetical protein
MPPQYPKGIDGSGTDGLLTKGNLIVELGAGHVKRYYCARTCAGAVTPRRRLARLNRGNKRKRQSFLVVNNQGLNLVHFSSELFDFVFLLCHSRRELFNAFQIRCNGQLLNGIVWSVHGGT